MDVKAAGGTAAITLPSIPVRITTSAAAAGAEAPSGDQVILSDAARRLVAGGVVPDLSRAARLDVDHDAMRAEMEAAQRAEKAKYNERFMAFVRDTLGVGKDVDVKLSGKIVDVLKKMAEKLGIEEPGAKSGTGAAKESDPDLDPVYEDSSVITLTFPKSRGGGSVSMFIDNDAFAQLGDVSLGDLEKGLVNMMDREGSGDLMRKAMESGLFGERMLKDIVEHPEWRQAKARYGFSMLGADSPPAFMIQSHDKPEYVQTNIKDLSRSLLRIAKAAGS